MSRNNSGITIGGRGQRQASPQRFNPTLRGLSGANPSVAMAGGPGRSSTPGLRTSGRGAPSSTPGVRTPGASARNDRLGPPRGQVLTQGTVNGIQVRVSAPYAPNPVVTGNVVNTTAKERNLSQDASPAEMASQSTTLIAGVEGTRRGGPSNPRRPAPPTTVAAPDPEPLVASAPEIIDAEILVDARTPGSYWSDKFDRFVAPGDSEYSTDTAKRMGQAG